MDPTLYKQLIGSLMYLVNTRPDICFAVNTMGFTKSDAERLIEGLQKRSCFEVRDEGHWLDALLSGFGGVAGGGAFLPRTR